MTAGKAWIVILVAAVVVIGVVSAYAIIALTPNLVLFTTIEKGSHSTVALYPEFADACTVARNVEDWTTLWHLHNRGTFHILPLPEVDFAREIVLGCFLDRQPTCCVANVTIVGIQVTETGYEVSVDRDYTQAGPESPSPSYPFHFVRVQRTEGSITFIDAGTGANIPVIAIEASS